MLIAALLVFVVLVTLLAVGLLRGGSRLGEDEAPDASAAHRPPPVPPSRGAEDGPSPQDGGAPRQD